MLKHPRAPRSIGDAPGRLPNLPKGNPDDGTATERQIERRETRDRKNRMAKKKAKTAKLNPYYPHPRHENPGDGKKPQINWQGQGLLILEDTPWTWPLDIDYSQWKNENTRAVAPPKPRGSWIITILAGNVANTFENLFSAGNMCETRIRRQLPTT
jgi:hypothetical protein